MADEFQPKPADEVSKEILDLDKTDPLQKLRDAFELPAGVSYFDGNSLGALTLASKAKVIETLEQAWGRDLIKSWNTHKWIDLPLDTGEKIAPLIGAATGQVIACDSVSVNLFKLLSAAVALNPGRAKILSTKNNFPTDLYIAAEFGAQNNPTITLDLVEPEGLNEAIEAIDDDVAVVMLTHVDYRSGRLSDLAAVTRKVHKQGALMLWDLSHSVGAVPLELDNNRVDLAVGCGYKYLNGGPGAPAFAYVAARHQTAFRQPLAGWMGHQSPFEFSLEYQPAAGVQSVACGTPPILSMASLYGALEVFDKVTMADLRTKSMALGILCQRLIDQNEAVKDLELASPVNPEERGSQIAYRHPDAYAICQALIERNIITDFRAPDLLRIGFAPLYLKYADVYRLVEALAEIMRSKTYRLERFSKRLRVT